MAQLPIVGPAYESRSTDVNAQKCVNWYLSPGGPGGKVPMILAPTPGLKDFSDVSGVNGEVRGLTVHKGILYGVVDNKFYSISAAGVAAELGTLQTLAGIVAFASIDDEICMVDGTEGYSYKVTAGTFTIISDSDFPSTAVSITSTDGYFVVPTPNAQSFYVSNLLDGRTWDTLDFASAEGGPDDLVNITADGRELWLFGERTTEVWYNAGTPFPFERIQGVFIQAGCAATHSVARLDNRLFWLGQSENSTTMVYTTEGFTPVIVSTPALNFALAGYETTSDAIGFSYTDDGHLFYVLTFPTEGVTWVYDILTQAWHERKSEVYTEQTRWRANCYAQAYNKHFVGDYSTGSIFEVDGATYTEDGTTIRRERVTGPITLDNRYFSCYNIVIDMESGIGLSTGQGSDPQIMLRVSKDGGHTFGKEMWRSPGAQGVYDRRAIWTRLGRARTMVFQLVATDPVKWVILGATAGIEPGAA